MVCKIFQNPPKFTLCYFFTPPPSFSLPSNLFLVFLVCCVTRKGISGSSNLILLNNFTTFLPITEPIFGSPPYFQLPI